MQKKHGFSLTEVLISLFLIASISLLLLKQQMQASQLLHQIIKRLQTLVQVDNESELNLKNQRGFSLVELFISLFISSLIISGLIQQYTQIKSELIKAQIYIDKEMEVQFVSELIRSSVRKAGFTPCLAISHLKIIDNRNEQTNLSALKYTKDNLLLNRMGDDFFVLSSIKSSREIKVPAEFKLKKSNKLLIADCYHAELQDAELILQNQHEQIIRLQRTLFFKYIPPVYIGHWVEESYFIKNKNHARSIYYKNKHIEELSPFVHSIDVSLQDNLVSVDLGLDDGLKRTLKTRIRMV